MQIAYFLREVTIRSTAARMTLLHCGNNSVDSREDVVYRRIRLWRKNGGGWPKIVTAKDLNVI